MIVVIVIILHLTAIGWGFFHQRTLSILEWDLGFHSNPSLFPPLWFSFCHLPRERADAFVKAFSPFLQSDNPFKGSLFWVIPSQNLLPISISLKDWRQTPRTLLSTKYWSMYYIGTKKSDIFPNKSEDNPEELTKFEITTEFVDFLHRANLSN